LKDDSWVVSSKGGTKYFFGLGDSGKLYNLSNKNFVKKWNISRIEDKNKNNIIYRYEKNDSQYYLSKIFYGGNEYSEGEYSLVFNYKNRNVFENYYPGFKVKTEKIISSIETFFKDERISKFIFNHKKSIDSRRELLENFQEISYASGKEEKKPKKEFKKRI
jgi:hypothetical protein